MTSSHLPSDVGVGVFDVNNPPTDDSKLKAAGVSTVTLDPRNEVGILYVTFVAYLIGISC